MYGKKKKAAEDKLPRLGRPFQKLRRVSKLKQWLRRITNKGFSSKENVWSLQTKWYSWYDILLDVKLKIYLDLTSNSFLLYKKLPCSINILSILSEWKIIKKINSYFKRWYLLIDLGILLKKATFLTDYLTLLNGRLRPKRPTSLNRTLRAGQEHLLRSELDSREQSPHHSLNRSPKSRQHTRYG